MLIGYTRCSTKDQVDGSTIQEQERMIRGAAMIRGVDAHDIAFFSDPAVSGSIALHRRPQGQVMLDSLRKGDIVVAAKLDRMFRSANDALRVVEDLKERGVGVILINMGNDPVTENGQSKLFFTMLAAFAEFERTCIQERTESGRASKKAQGGCLGEIPYGMSKVGSGKGSRLVDNPEEQLNIQAMIRLRRTGMTYQCVADVLAQEKVFNRSGVPFGRQQVYLIVKRYAPRPRGEEAA